MRYLFYGTQIWCFCNTTKIPFIFIIMDTFQQFCDVFVACYIIVIWTFHWKAPRITLYGILFGKPHKKLHRIIFLKHSSKPWSLYATLLVTTMQLINVWHMLEIGWIDYGHVFLFFFVFFKLKIHWINFNCYFFWPLGWWHMAHHGTFNDHLTLVHF